MHRITMVLKNGYELTGDIDCDIEYGGIFNYILQENSPVVYKIHNCSIIDKLGYKCKCGTIVYIDIRDVSFWYEV